MKKQIKLLIVISVVLSLIPITANAWRSKGDREEPDHVGGSTGNQITGFVDKGFPAPTVSAPKPHALNGKINVKFNGEYEYFTNSPIIADNRVLIPFRELFEFLNMKVDWNGEDRKVTASSDTTNIELIINETRALVNGAEKHLDVPAQIIENRTYVPVRFIAESVGYDVSWESIEKTVIINQKEGDIE